MVERVRAKAAVYGQDEISLGADSKRCVVSWTVVSNLRSPV